MERTNALRNSVLRDEAGSLEHQLRWKAHHVSANVEHAMPFVGGESIDVYREIRLGSCLDLGKCVKQRNMGAMII